MSIKTLMIKKLSIIIVLSGFLCACGGGGSGSDPNPDNNTPDNNTKVVATPAFSISSGTYDYDISVTVTCATENVDIYYTNNGENPTSSSLKYESPVSISGNNTSMTLKMIAVKTDYENSDIATASYIINYITNSCDNPDSAWLLCENFEDGNGDFDSWFEQTDFISAHGKDDRGRVDISSIQAHSGRQSLYMPASPQSGYQGSGLDWYACEEEQKTNCPLKSFDKLYFRAWVRFAEDHKYIHHFLSIGGSKPDDFWYHGTAGCLPNGELSMGTTVDSRPDSHNSFFYTYFPEMSCDTRCERYMDVDQLCAECEDKGLPTCTVQPQCCWGNNFEPEPSAPFPVGEWFCLEMMMQANTPGEHDGTMAYWINGKLVHTVDNLMWRTSPELVLNRVRLQHYITTSDAKGHSNRVWFDDVVVSTEKIGCE